MKTLFDDSTAIDKKAFNSIFIAVLLVLFHQTYVTFLSNVFNLLIALVIVVLLARGCYIYMSVHRVPKIVQFFFLLIIYFIIVGILHGGPFINILNLLLSQDLRYVFLFLAGGIFACKNNMKYFHRIMKIIASLSIFASVLALYYLDFSIQVISSREGTWTISYFYWWASSCCFIYCGFYSMFMKKEKILGYGSMASYVILGLLFLKRIVVVQFFAMIIFYILFSKKNIVKYFVPILVFILFSFFIYSLFGSNIDSIYSLLMARFDVGIDDDSYSNESELFWEYSSWYDLLFGQGIGHYIDASSIRGEEGLINALHIGWLNLPYKGGLLYSLYYVLLLIPVAGKIVRPPKDDYDRVCLGTALFAFMGPGWTYTLLPFCVSAPLFYTVIRPSRAKSMRFL